MPPRRPTRPTPPDVDVLRAALGQGKLVRVGIAPSDQFPDGVTGRVRRIGDPAVDGDEYIFVEVPVGGAKDVLPFAAADLTGPPVRKRTAATPDPSSAGTSRPKAPATPPLSTGSRSRPELAPSATSTTGAPQATRTAPAASIPATRAPGAVPSVSPISSTDGLFNTPRSVTGQSVSPAAGRQPAPPTSRGTAAARGKRAPVSITISTAGDESASWRIEAKIGAKVAVRSTSIPPTRVWEIVQSLGEPKLTTLVQNLLDDHRRSTQSKADALAAQLSALQAELRTFPQD